MRKVVPLKQAENNAELAETTTKSLVRVRTNLVTMGIILVVLAVILHAGDWKGTALPKADAAVHMHPTDPPVAPDEPTNVPALFCDQNSQASKCCTIDHCKVVAQSSLYSECCHNDVPVAYQGTSVPPRFPLLVTGTPRSGTVFVQRLLKGLGLPVTNDWSAPKTSRNDFGQISWMHIYKDVKYYGPAVLNNSKFDAVWHQVRDPLKSLTSIAFTEPLEKQSYLQFLQKHILITPKEQVMQLVGIGRNSTSSTDTAKEDFLIWRGLEFYLQWHRFILRLKVRRFQLEDLVVRHNMTLLDEIFQSANHPAPNHTKALESIQQDRRRRLHTNSRKHRPTLEWPELCRVDLGMAQEFLELSHHFGYYGEQPKAC